MSDTVKIFKDEVGEWRWHRKAGNGKIISQSSEGYTHHADAKAVAERLNDDDDVKFKDEIEDDA